MGENGGIVNDESYSSHSESDNSVINTNLNSSTNFIVSSGIGFEHFFNLLSQKKTITKKEASPFKRDTIALFLTDSIRPNSRIPLQLTDSIPIDSIIMDSVKTISQEVIQETKERKFTLGRICHSFSYLNNKLYYNESSPSAAFYQPFDTLLNMSKSTDTTLVRAIRNTLKWNSLGYQKYYDDIPFYLYAGVSHGFYKVKQFDYLEGETILLRNYNQLSVNGGIIINLMFWED